MLSALSRRAGASSAVARLHMRAMSTAVSAARAGSRALLAEVFAAHCQDVHQWRVCGKPKQQEDSYPQSGTLTITDLQCT